MRPSPEYWCDRAGEAYALTESMAVAEANRPRMRSGGARLPVGKADQKEAGRLRTGPTRRERWCVRWHRRRWVVFRDEGWHEHVGCPKCGCEFGINHAVRMILPWRVVGPAIVRIDWPKADEQLEHPD